MRKIRYVVAASLDGYISGPNGETDWIVADPSVDFTALFAQFDTLLVGRKTFDIMVQAGRASMPGMSIFVFSKTLAKSGYPAVTVVAERQMDTIRELRAQTGKDIWLFGGSTLFRSLLEARLVDSVEISIMPVLLGGGVPLLPSPAHTHKLELVHHHIYKSGIARLHYGVKEI